MTQDMKESSLLFYSYQTLAGKYRKFAHSLDRAVRNERFQPFRKRKKQSLLNRSGKLRTRIQNLYAHLIPVAIGTITCVFLSMINSVQAQTTIGPFHEMERSNTPLRWPFRFSSNPRPVTIDWDHDGDYDVVAGHQGELLYFENNGTKKKPSFNERTGSDNPFENIGPGTGDAAPAFVDFDHDFDMDLFVGSADDDVAAILYYKNVNGTFVFQDPDTDWNNEGKTGNPFYSLSSHVWGSSNYLSEHAKVLFVDWDTDGDWDAFIGQDLEATDFYYYENRLNTEDHAFIPRSPTEVGLPSGLNTMGYGQSAQYADIDQDGDSDLIIGSDGGSLIFIANNGENIYAQQEGPWNPETKEGNPFNELGYFSATPHIVDLDDDADLDIILGVSGGGFEGRAMVYLENQGNAVFVEQNTLDNPLDGYISSGDYTHSDKGGIPEFIDVDNDSDLDVLIGDKYSSEIIFYRNDNSEFHEAQSPLGDATFTEESYPSAVDINGDGFTDVFVGQVGNESDPFIAAIRLFINNQDGTFTETPEDIPFPNEHYYEPLDLVFVDVDNDSDFDAWLCGDSDPVFYRNNGTAFDPIFTEDEASDPLGNFSGSKSRLNAIDIDGDRDLDILHTNSNSGIRLFLNDGNGEFSEITGSDNPFDHVSYDQVFPGFTDHDQDGDNDVFINIIGGEFRYLKNENPPPVLASNNEGSERELTPGGGPSVINNDFGLDDPDDDTYKEAIVKILEYEQGHDFLELNQDWSESFEDLYFDPATGKYHLVASGSTSGSDLENALASMTYQYIGEEGEFQRRKNSSARSITKTIRFEVFDADRTHPVPVDFVYSHANVVPQLLSTAPDVTYKTPSSAVILDNMITITDADDLNMTSATVSILNFQSAQDILMFNDQNGIAGNFSSVTGVLTLTGSATKANYETALHSVRYRNIASIPNLITRTISFVVNDNEGGSTAETVDLNFNFPPVLTPSQTSVSYGGAPVFIDNAITITDIGEALNSASIHFSAGYQSSQDTLVVTPQGGITSFFNGAVGAIVLSGNASRADYEATLRSITYRNKSSTPTPGSRTVEISVRDDVFSVSNGVYITINYTSQLPPVLASTVSSVNYSSGQLIINNAITITDPDNTNIESATVSILSGFAGIEDVLTFTPADGITGSYNATTGILSLSGSAALASYQSVLRSVIYQNTNTGDRNKTTRNIVFRVNDGVDNSNTLGSAVMLPNQAPVLVNTISPPAYVMGSLTIASQLSIADADNATLQNATVIINSGLQSSEDVLLFGDQNGISGEYTPATGTLQLSGSATIANYQAALRSVQYANTSIGDRNKNTRIVAITVNDGIVTSNSTNVSIALPNQAPALSLSVNPPLYGSEAILIASQLTLTDHDNATMQSATLTITSGLSAAEDTLQFTDQNGISGSYIPSAGMLQLTGNASKADYQAAIRSIQYQNSAALPSEAPRIISITINDGMNTSNTAIITITINRPPILISHSEQTGAGESIEIDLRSLVTDPDNNLDLANINSVTIVSSPSSGATVSVTNGILSVDYSSVPDFKGTDHLMISVCDNLGRCSAEELTIEVDAGLQVFNAISVNKDDKNAYLFLRYISAANKVSIYNRWGDKVFEMKDYDNDKQEKRFEGLSDNGNELSSGTYFYKIEHASGVATGYLSLKR